MMMAMCTQLGPYAWSLPQCHLKAPSQKVQKSQKTHSMSPEKKEIFKSLESWVSESVLPPAKPVEECWQPHDLLPDSSLPSDEFIHQVQALRDRTAELPDDYLVALVGSMITEEALPTYQTWINKLDGIGDETGSSLTPWAIWSRSWTAEENRHGDLLKTYVYLSGRVDMCMIEKTIQYLIGAGVVIYIYLSLSSIHIHAHNWLFLKRETNHFTRLFKHTKKVNVQNFSYFLNILCVNSLAANTFA